LNDAYLYNFIKIPEVLRLYPAISRLERQCIKDYKIPDTNLIIPKGTMIAISAEAIHRDENHYPNPLKFDPERFNDVNKVKRNNYAYMPFGIGLRNCIGKNSILTKY
jgi:cytochrome P450 family 6